MIRRHVGNDYWLIAQHDHALLAGALARHVGNKLFDAPRERRDSFLRGVALHDCGWPLHDDAPTLNDKKLPIDVFEGTPAIALMVWQASVDRALETGDEYAALLVSLHVLSLSIFASTPSPQPHEKFDLDQTKTRFEVNRFQHKQIETQEQLRRKLGLPIDQSMRHGLIESPSDPGELLLQYHFRLLQAMDQISLALCCTQPPYEQIKNVLTRAGGKTLTMNVSRASDTELLVSPWPFDAERVQVSTPYRAVEARQFRDDAELREAFNRASARALELDVLPG